MDHSILALGFARKRLEEWGINSLRVSAGFGAHCDYGLIAQGGTPTAITGNIAMIKAHCRAFSEMGFSANRWHIWSPGEFDRVADAVSTILEIDPKAEFELFRKPDVYALGKNGKHIGYEWLAHTAELMVAIDRPGLVLCGHLEDASGAVQESWVHPNGETMFSNDFGKMIAGRLDFVALDIFPSAKPSYEVSASAYVRHFREKVFSKFRDASYSVAKSVHLGEFNISLPTDDVRAHEYREALIEFVKEFEHTGVLYTLFDPGNKYTIYHPSKG